MEYQIAVAHEEPQNELVLMQSLMREEVPRFLNTAFPRVAEFPTQQGIKPSGPPFARYRVDGDTLHVAAGFPVPSGVVGSGHVLTDELPGGDIASTVHVGSYEDLPVAFHAVMEWLTGAGYEIAGEPWESYLDQADVPQPRTQVNFPVARGT